MQIVIEIPEEIYQDTVDGVEDADIAGVPVGKISRAIANGTPLPDDAIIIDAKEQSDYVFVEKAKYNDLVEAASKALTDRIKKSLYEGVTADCARGNAEADDMAIEALEQEPCDDCIGREETIQIIRAWFDRDAKPSELTNEVEQMPPVTPQPKTGHWVRQSDDYHDYYECEHCGIAVGLDDIRNYCPNCGARMKDGD